MAKIRNPLTVVNSRLQSKTLTLGASAPAAVSPDSGYDGLSSVPVTLDTSVFKAENIKSGVTLAGITGTAGDTGLVLLDSCWYNESVWSVSYSKQPSSASVQVNAFSDSTASVTGATTPFGVSISTGGLKGLMFTSAIPVTGYTTLHISLTMMPITGSSSAWGHSYIMLSSSTGISKPDAYEPTDKIKEVQVWQSAYMSKGYAYACFKREFTLTLSDITAENVYLFFNHCDGYMQIEKIWLT